MDLQFAWREGSGRGQATYSILHPGLGPSTGLGDCVEAGLPLAVGPGSQKGSETIYVQVSDTLALNVNSRVRVAW